MPEIDCLGWLSDEALALAVGALGILVLYCWDRDHLAVITLAAQPMQSSSVIIFAARSLQSANTFTQAFNSRSAERLRKTIRRGVAISMAALFARLLNVRETVSKVRPR